MGDASHILCEIDESGLATVTINRPDKFNALTDEMVQDLHDTLMHAAADEAVRVILLTGAGRAFCTGGDVGGMDKQTPRQIINKLRRPFDQNSPPDFQTRHTYFPAIPKPLIAVINGPVVGIGLLYALACDVRFAADDAVFTTGYARLGFGAEYGIAWFLEHAVGHAAALDLLLSSRKVKGEEVRELGLANFVVPKDELMARARAYAGDMASGCSPQSFAFIKRQMWAVPNQTLAENVRVCNFDMLTTNDSPDFHEGQRAFLEKRPPRFPPLRLPE